MATQLKGEEKKTIAEESRKTKKARLKLLKQLKKEESAITPQALERSMIEIHRWIAGRAPERVVLKSKNIRLFDRNESPAKVSKRVEAFAQKIECGITSSSSTLKERVTSVNNTHE